MSEKFANQSLKDVLHAVVFRSSVHPKEIAARTGISYGRLSNYANELQEDSHIPAKHITPVTLASNNTELVEYICFCSGGIFVPVPKPNEEIKLGDARDQVLEMVSEIGCLAADFVKAAEDNNLDKHEAAHIEKILIRLSQRSIRLNFALASMAK